MSSHHNHLAGSGQRYDLLHWLLFLLAAVAAYVIGPPAAIAQENTRSSQHEMQALDSPAAPESPGEVRDTRSAEPDHAAEGEEAADEGPEAPQETPDEAREWSDDAEARDAYAHQLVGSWRIDLTQFMTRQIAEKGRPGLAMIAGALTQELFGESYGLVTAEADGTGSALGIWFGEPVEGTGSWEVLAVDGEHARLRLVVPEYGIDRVFEIRRESDRVYAHYQRLPAIFVRQTD